MPNLVVIAGPNGAGKSTAAPLLIGKRLGIADFVNADVIASGLSAYAPKKAAVEAGRVMLRRLDQLADSGADFAFETTLASRSFAPWIAKLRRERGYRFHLCFLWIPDPEQSVRRVARRVMLGGHSVPPDVIRRRHGRGLANFEALYRPLADTWVQYQNSTDASLAQASTETRLMGLPSEEITASIHQAARDARRRHKAFGVPLVVCRGGKIVDVPPEEIEI